MSILESLQQQDAALWTALGLCIAGLCVGTARKTLSDFSKKGLLERVVGSRRERYLAYLAHLDEYHVALRLLDQGVRLAFVGCLVAAAVLAIERDEVALALGGKVLAYATVVATIFGGVLVFLELVPAVLARLSPERLVILLLPGLYRLYRITAAPLSFFESLVGFGARALGSQPARKPAEVVSEEILSAAEEGQREGVLEKSEISMIEAIIEFSDREVSEVLTPRTEMVAIEADTPIEKSVELAIECGHSRIPVYRDNRDQIIGLLYVKDLLKFLRCSEDEPRRLENLVRKPHFVPKTKKVSELFQEFKTQRFHIAIVLDEFGGTAGLITIEDIVEEVLGEIEEEFEKADETRGVRFNRLGEDTVEIGARLTIYDLNRELNSEFNGSVAVTIPEGESFDTVGGFLSSAMGKIPSIGETYQHGQLRFEVIDADERSVHRIRIHVSTTGAKAARG